MKTMWVNVMGVLRNCFGRKEEEKMVSATSANCALMLIYEDDDDDVGGELVLGNISKETINKSAKPKLPIFLVHKTEWAEMAQNPISF